MPVAMAPASRRCHGRRPESDEEAIASKQFRDGLLTDVGTQLEAALKDATQYANAIAGQGSRDALEATRKAGKTEIYTFNDAGNTECCTALLPVRKDVKGRAGKEVLAAVDKESAVLAVKQGALPPRLAWRGGCAAQ